MLLETGTIVDLHGDTGRTSVYRSPAPYLGDC